MPLDSDVPATWAMPLPLNRTGADIRIESINLINPVGLELLGVLASYPTPSEGLINAYGFPPPGVVTSPVENAVLPVAGSPNQILQILIGIKRPVSVDAGTIDGLRVRYRAGSERFEVSLPWSLRVTAPQD